MSWGLSDVDHSLQAGPHWSTSARCSRECKIEWWEEKVSLLWSLQIFDFHPGSHLTHDRSETLNETDFELWEYRWNEDLIIAVVHVISVYCKQLQILAIALLCLFQAYTNLCSPTTPRWGWGYFVNLWTGVWCWDTKTLTLILNHDQLDFATLLVRPGTENVYTVLY